MTQSKTQLPENEVQKINRLIQVRKHLNLKQEDFAPIIGIKERSNLSKIENLKENRNVPNGTGYILEKEFGIDRNWFETGIGEMIINDQEIERPTIVKPSPGKITSVNAGRRNSNALIPFYNADFMAGNSEVFYEDGTIFPEYYMDVPEFTGCVAFRAYSDSMEPKVRSGNILFGKKMDDWRSHLEYGQIYGITCKNGRRYLKYIRRHKDHDRYFVLKSENPEYDDFDIPKSAIKNIWLIEGWLDKRT